MSSSTYVLDRSCVVVEADIEPTLSDASRREAELEIKKYFQDPTREELQHLSDAELIELCREIC